MYEVANQLSNVKETRTFTTDENGYLYNAQDWHEAFAEQVLADNFTQLTAEHFKVIFFVREKVLHLGALPPLRHVCKSTGLDKAELKRLFGSCLFLWKAAGLPAPDDEIRSHMN